MSTESNPNPPQEVPGSPLPTVSPAPEGPEAKASPPTGSDRQIVVYSHSGLFYWWPVWAFGYLMAAISWFGGWTMAIVPGGTVAARDRLVQVDPADPAPGKLEKRSVLVLPPKGELLTRKDVEGNVVVDQPRLHVSRHKGVGTVFLIILILTIIITNVPLRGLWSVFVLMVLILGSILLWVAGLWESILASFGLLSVHINLGAYVFLSTVLLAFWLFNFLVMDRQVYMIFTPGQLRVCIEIGGGETVYDTTGMVVQKERGDLFRHWILGFGSGDLVVQPVGLANPLQLPNVLNVGFKVNRITQMIKEKVIVTVPPRN